MKRLQILVIVVLCSGLRLLDTQRWAHILIAGAGPWAERDDLDALHPAAREPIEAVLAELASGGHPARVSATWRSPARQAILFSLSGVAERLGFGPGTRASAGASCHNLLLNGAPAATAADIRSADARTTAEEAAFYKALGRTAEAHGLRWGGRWVQRNPTWAAYDLGWDPGHIEHRAQCRSLRSKQPDLWD